MIRHQTNLFLLPLSLQQLQKNAVQSIFEKKEKAEVPSSGQAESVQKPSEQPPKQSEEKICLICKGRLNQYVVFPNCKTPHIYCVPCAENMLSAPQPRQPYSYPYVPPSQSNSKGIRCALCQSFNSFGDRGLDSFKRIVPRSTSCYSTGYCDRHKDMSIIYYCFDCVEAACVKCAPSHSKHRFDTLESAIGQSKNSLSVTVNQLVDTQSSLVEYRSHIEKEKEVVLKEGAQRRQELVSQIQQIRDLLAATEVKLMKGIEAVENKKIHSLNSESNWASEKERLTEKSLQNVGDLMDIDNPLSFFKKMTDCDEVFRETQCIAVKKPQPRPPNTCLFPPLPTRQFIRALSSMSYKDSPYPYPYDPQGSAPLGGYAYAPQYSQDEYIEGGDGEDLSEEDDDGQNIF